MGPADQKTATTTSLLDWVITRRYQLVPDRVFDLSRHRYLAAIYADEHPHLLVCKAAQMGASEYAISYVLWAADEHKATPLYVFPTDRAVSDFATARLGPAIEASQYLQALITPAGGQGKRGADRIQLKRVGDRFLYMRGATVLPDGRAPQLKSVDADVLVLDELDEMPAKARPIAVKRLGHSELKWIRELSTPTYTGVGIDAEFAKSDQRHWQVQCSGCSTWQTMTIDHVVLEWDALGRPVAWHGQKERRAYVACRSCGAELDRLGDGHWEATYPGRQVHGYHLSGLFSAQKTVESIVAALHAVDETKRKECFNQDLGLTYTPSGGRLTDEVLDECRRDYAQSPAAGGDCYAGVDVGKLLHVVVRGRADPETGERAARLITAVESFDELGRLFRLFGVKRAVVDALPETRAARDFQEGMAGVVWLAYYTDAGTRGGKAEPIIWNEAEGTVTLDRTRTLDDTFSRFVLQSNTLPANVRDVADYYDQLKAPVRVMDQARDGNQVPRYVETGPDHYAHAENYCAAAFEAPAPALPQSQVVTRQQVLTMFE